MSSPAPIPSKAAIHALRGLLFGTSCSIVLLAEERRRRISIARAAVENGRKLKSLRCYTTAGSSALEALQEDGTSDSIFINRSFYSRTDPYARNVGFSEPEWAARQQKDTDDLGPDPRHRHSGRRRDSNTSPPSNASNHREEPLSSRSSGANLEPSRLALRSRVDSKLIQPGPSRLPAAGAPNGPKSIMLALEEFWSRAADGLPSDSSLRKLQNEPRHSEPTTTAAMELVRRAYASVADAEWLPLWLLQLCQLLSVACLHEGDSLTAGRILVMVTNHGPVANEYFLAHQPFQLVEALLSNPTTGASADGQPPESLQLAAEILLAEISDDVGCRAQHATLASRIVNQLLSTGHVEAATEVFNKSRQVCRLGTASTVRFMGRLRRGDWHAEAIDTFVGLRTAHLDNTSDLQKLCDRILHSVLQTKGYGAAEVLRTWQWLHDNAGVRILPSWPVRVLRAHWRGSQKYRESREIYQELRDKEFCGIHDTYSIRSTMIQIALEADDAVQASVLFAELLALSHKAGTDVELACAFAKHDAMKSKWDRVKSRFEKVNNRGPLTKDEQQAYDAGFGAVLSEYAKSHTWGETEEFVEEYTQKLRVSLDNTLVTFIADKHGRCREFKALDQWLSYCKDAGFVTTAAFWKSMLVKCKKQWGYGEVEAASLFKTLQEQDIESDFPEAEAVVRSMMIPIQREFPMKRIRIATPKRPMDIGSTFERMKLDAQKGQWKSVLSTYNRAVRNGQGYSSGCLQLAVQASMKVNEPSTEHAVSLISKAQSDGHDISNAMVPLVLADLDEIQAVGQQMRDSSEARASGPAAVRPFPAIQRLFSDLLEQGHQIDNFVFHRAAQVCLALRNYREVVTICVFAAQCNGSRDLAYSVWNFSDLCQAFTKQHEYARLRWLMSDVLGRDYRMTKQCRTSLKWVVHYLKRASQADKDEDLKASDLSMLACVEETLKKVTKEKAQWKASERANVAQIVARQNEKQARTRRTEAGGLDYYAPLRRGLDGKPPRWSGRVEEEQEDGSTAVGNKAEA